MYGMCSSVFIFVSACFCSGIDMSIEIHGVSQILVLTIIFLLSSFFDIHYSMYKTYMNNTNERPTDGESIRQA